MSRPTVDALLEAGEKKLKKANVEFPDTSALWLLAHALGVPDPDVLDERGDERVGKKREAAFWRLVKRRKKHEPYQYIVGATDFRGALMRIGRGVFVPRLQSERMCDEIEEWAADHPVPSGGWRIADLGCGCGALGISLALGSLSVAHVLSVDISPEALKLVRQNAKTHDVAERVHPIAGDWLSVFRREPNLDIICTVPPYLNPGDEEYLSEESLRWEPLDTFFGEPSGDRLLEFILDESPNYLRPGGLVALQLDSEQVSKVESYVNDDPNHPLAVEWILQDEDGDEDAILAVRL